MNLFTRCCLLLILTFFSVFSATGQVASFSATPTAGCAPLVVDFTNLSTGFSTCEWDFGNGDNSTLTGSTSTSYLTPGTYTVKLTVYSSTGASSVHTETITVYPKPTVTFVASETGVCVGEPVTFTSTGSAGVSGAVSYEWAFGDGGTSTSATPTHTYNTTGYKTVTLTVTNGEGCVATLVKGTYIDVYTPPVAGFSAAPTYVCNPPAGVTFTASSSGVSPLSYEWYFGDGSTGTGSSPTHNYTSLGTYSIKLVVTDGDGCKDTLTKPAYIDVGHATASFTAPATACASTPVYFDNTTTGAVSSNWSFGTGATSGSSSPYYSFSTAGTYTVTLVVFNGGCYDTVYHAITIYPQAMGSFTWTPTEPCGVPATLSFTGTIPSGCSAAWEFGDGGTGSGTTVSHTYTSIGGYKINMIITNADGCNDTVSQIDSIYNLKAEINDIDSEGCVPLTDTFSAYAYTILSTGMEEDYPYGITSYSWNFGDGSPPSTGTSPFHIYTAQGVYTATVTIVTSNGCTVTAEKKIYVVAPPPASFSASSITVCYGQTVSFTNTTPGVDGFSYLWSFGDGTFSNDTNVLHTYTNPGTGYKVELIASYYGCSDTFVSSYSITVDSPKAIISITYPCSPDDRVAFVDKSLGDNSHKWFFGDGITSTANDTIHDYPSLTVYTVTLTTYNAASGCRDTAHAIVNLAKPIPSIITSHTAICADNVIHFSSLMTGGTASSYYWYINGIMLAYGSGDSTMTNTFGATGIYTVTLVVEDQHNCYDTSLPVYDTVIKPIDTFTVDSPIGCSPLTVTFTDLSTDIAGITPTSFAWTFGDGTSGSVSTLTTTHTYTTAGTYDIREIVTDSIGCKDTLTRMALITLYKPIAAFSASATTACENIPIMFTNLSAGIVSSFWIFGDDSTSTENSPTHTYKANGNYTVSLVVTDAHGCTDTAAYKNYIHIGGPAVSFYMTDSITICLPLTVDFINTTTGAISYMWYLGDGSTSVLVSPSDIYVTPGIDTVLLIATNAYGCSDTAIGHISIYGGAGGFSYGPVQGCSPLTVYFGADISNIPNIVWDFADGTTLASSYSDSASHTYTIPGAYVPKLVLSNNTGCEQSSQGLDTIKVDAVIPGFTTDPDPVCMNTPFNFKDTSIGYFAPITSWLWTFDTTAGDTSDISDPSYVYHKTGTFIINLQVADGWGCKGEVTEDVNVYPPPVITVSSDTTVCVGDAAVLTGYGGISYSWLPSSSVSCSLCTTTDATPSVVTQYTVTGTDIHGCPNTDTVTVFLKTTTISKGWGDTAICIGDAVPLFDSGGTKYTWIPLEGLNDPNIPFPIASPTATTTYEVISQLADCAPDTNYVKVIVHPLPTVNAGSDRSLVAGSTVQLEATGILIDTYAWSPSESLSCNSCSDPVASMTVTTTYVVQVASLFGCKNEDSVTIHLFCDKSQVFIPNSFTPNGDGQNDVFYPRGSGISLVKSFRIYNRWGELLFERSNIEINDVSNAWDGSYNGSTPKADVYVYIIDAICETGEPINLKGDVTIIR